MRFFKTGRLSLDYKMARPAMSEMRGDEVLCSGQILLP